jgi:hypothetical protein
MRDPPGRGITKIEGNQEERKQKDGLTEEDIIPYKAPKLPSWIQSLIPLQHQLQLHPSLVIRRYGTLISPLWVNRMRDKIGRFQEEVDIVCRTTG